MKQLTRKEATMAMKTTRLTAAPGPLGKELFKAPREFWLAGLGTLSLARKEGSRFFDKLVVEGEKFEKRSRERVEKEAGDVRDRVLDLTSGIKLPRALNKALGRAETVVFHLVPEGQKWAVRREGDEEDFTLHRTKAAGLEAARGLAHAHEPSRVVVHRADGTIQTSYSYGEAA
jgi:hypothetical protein